MQQKVLISQDLSCVGQVSLEVALPIIGACGFSPAILPTAILSTHTGGFGNNTFFDLASEMKKISHHWQEINLNFDALYLGYLGQGAVDFWIKNINSFTNSAKTVLLDPAMADHGKLYSGLDETYVKKMRLLAKSATILTPNMTEAQLLLDIKPSTVTTFSLQEAKNLVEKLQNKFLVEKIVLTGIPLKNNEIGMVGTDTDEKIWSVKQRKLPGSFFGTGDMFASVFLSAYLKGQSLQKATQTAAIFIEKAIQNTDSKQDARFGPNYAVALPWLIAQIQERE